MTDIPRPADGSTGWGGWGDEQESSSDAVLYGRLEAATLLEAIRDEIGAVIVAGANITKTVDDAANTVTIAATAGVPTTRTITAGTGLTGGGDLSANRTLTVSFGTTAGTVTEGSDTRVTGAAQRALTKRTITGAYTLVAADATDIVLHSTAAGAVTITLPSDTVTIGQEIAIPWRQYGAGQITFTPGAGATLVSRGSVFKSAGQNAEGVVTKVAASVWLLSGDIAA